MLYHIIMYLMLQFVLSIIYHREDGEGVFEREIRECEKESGEGVCDRKCVCLIAREWGG